MRFAEGQTIVHPHHGPALSDVLRSPSRPQETQ